MDIVFGNIEELKSLYQTDFHGAVQAIAKDAELAAITMGADGAMVVHEGEIITVPAYAVPEVVDVTGAGDLFASGFLLAIARERDYRTALQAGCLAASEVISHIGARPVADLQALAAEKGIGI
jgi:sugar/nucleoside kinase (ribokinase family)